MQTLRGKMWRTFLGLESVKQEGYYEQLVYQALGSKYSKRKVAACASPAVISASIDTGLSIAIKCYATLGQVH